MKVTPGSTDVTTYFVLRLAADGTEATGLTITNIDLQYVRSGAAPVAKVDATALAATDSAHADNKAIEIDATDAPGLYRVDWPDAAFEAGVREVILTVKCATAFTEHLRVQLETVQTGDSFARLGAPAGASVSADIAAIEAQTDDIGAAGAGLTAVPWNAAWDAEVESEVNDALVAQNLDHLVKIAVDTNFATTVHADSVIGQIADNGAGFDRTTDSLEAIRDNVGTAGAGLTAIDLPDQTMNITGNITGNLSGSVGSVTGNVGGTINGLTAVALKDFFDTDSTTTYASAVAGSVVKEIADNAGGSALTEAGIAAAVWDLDATGHQTQGTFGQAIGDPAADTNTIFKAVVTDATGATVGADTAAILDDTGTSGVVVAAASKSGYALSATGSAALTEGYATLGAAATLPQLLYEVRALLAEKAISSTTLTTKKLDGATTAATYTLDDATTPTSITRAT